MNADVGSPPQSASGHARPRVWWCPVGLFALLPLHAAGQYSYDSNSACGSDYVVSSYIPTVSSLNGAPWVGADAAANRGKVLQVVQLSLPETVPFPGTINVQLEHIHQIVPPGALLYSGSLHFKGNLAENTNILPVLEESSRRWLRLQLPQRATRQDPRRSPSTQMEQTESLISRAFHTPYDSITDGQSYPDFSALAAIFFAAGYKSSISVLW